MCGLFGFVGEVRDRQAFVEIALQAAGRGPHAHGWAMVCPDGSLLTQRYLGPLRKNVKQFAAMLDEARPRALIGHARLSTTGADSYSRIEDVQPVIAGSVSLVHNGNADFGENNPAIDSGNDSERIAVLMARFLADEPSDPVGALLATLETLPARAPYAVLALYRNQSMLLSRRGLPLYLADRDGVTVISSMEFPGSSWLEPGITELAVA